MLTVPSFQEEPAPVIELLKAYAALDGDSPADFLKRQKSERLEQTHAVLAALGWTAMARSSRRSFAGHSGRFSCGSALG